MIYNIYVMIEKIIESINSAETEAELTQKKAAAEISRIEKANQLEIEKLRNDAEVLLKDELKSITKKYEKESSHKAEEYFQKNEKKTKKNEQDERIKKAKKYIMAEFIKRI